MDDLSDVLSFFETGTYSVTRFLSTVYWNGVVVEQMQSLWAATTSYGLDTLAQNGTRIYVVITAGVSAASGGPAGTGLDIIDGTVHWRYLTDVSTSLSAKGVLAPVDGRVLERLPEGMRGKELKEFYTDTQLICHPPSPDQISISGENWEVSTVENWSELGNYYRVLIQKVGP